jgi:hypothetical protein
VWRPRTRAGASVKATFKADMSEFERQLAKATSVLAQGPMKPTRPSGAHLFACDYCAGMSDGLSCVHCGAPRRVMTKSRLVEVTAHNDPIRTYLET